jgi:CheY-like chemotaxis protein
MNGTEAMHKLRDMGYTQPIVALTANALIGKAEEFIQEGFDGFLSKPIQTKHLNSMLLKLIKDKQEPEIIAAAIEQWQKEVRVKGDINAFQHNPELLKKLTESFIKNNRNKMQEIQQAIDENDMHSAHFLSHSLKGEAGLINETGLANAVEKLEYSFEAVCQGESTKFSQKLLTAAQTEFEEVFERLLKKEEQAAQKETAFKRFDKNEVATLLDKLQGLLETRSTQSLNFLGVLRSFKETAEIADYVEKLNFAAALDALKKIDR